MAKISSSPPLATGTKRKKETSAMSGVKKDRLFLTTSLQEGFQYVKALFIGLVKKATVRNEKEATEAHLLTAKIGVEAADNAEETKKRIDKSL